MRHAAVIETTLLAMLLATLGLAAVTAWSEDPVDDLHPRAAFTDGGRFLVQVAAGRVQAVDAATGTVRWRRELPMRTSRATTVAPRGAGAVVRDTIHQQQAAVDPQAATVAGADDLQPLRRFPTELLVGPDGWRVAGGKTTGVGRRTAFGQSGDGVELVHADGRRRSLPLPEAGAMAFDSVQFSPDGHLLVAHRKLGDNPTDRLVTWNLRREQPAGVERKIPGRTVGLCVHDDGSLVGYGPAWVPVADRDPPPIKLVLLRLGSDAVLRHRLWLADADGTVRNAKLPDDLHQIQTLHRLLDRRVLALATLPPNDSGVVTEPPVALVYDTAAGELLYRWPVTDSAAEVVTRFAAPRTLRVAGVRDGTLEHLDVLTGRLTRTAVVRPPNLQGRRGWFVPAALAVLALWLLLWTLHARLLTDGHVADRSFQVAAVLVAAVLAWYLLTRLTLVRTPLLWAWLPQWSGQYWPTDAHRLVSVALALPTLVWLLPTAWWNRRRLGRLAWLLALAVLLVAPLTVGVDRMLQTDLVPARLRPIDRKAEQREILDAGTERLREEMKMRLFRSSGRLQNLPFPGR